VSNQLISFDTISQDVTAYSDTGSSIGQYSENGINIHVYVDGDSNDVSINFGDISKKRTNSTGSEYYDEVDDVCHNVKYGTGEYCATYCYDCENAGAVYDTSSFWYGLPFYLKVITLPFLLPFAPMGSMRWGTNQLITEDAIEYKPQDSTTSQEQHELVEETPHTSTQELSDKEKEFLDTIYAISGEEPVYTKEAYNEIMWGGYQDEEPIVEQSKEEESYDIFSHPENQRFLKTA